MAEDRPDEGRGRGHPTDYRPEFAEQAAKLCRLGATDLDMADFFDVSVRTIYRWKHAHEDFCHALTRAKDDADSLVEASLFRRATGYSHQAIKIFQYEGAPVEVPYTEHHAPDTTACIFWLKNRNPEKWRDKTDHEHSGTLSLEQLVTDAAAKRSEK